MIVSLSKNIKLGENFTPEKTSDKFHEVIFKYGNTEWSGCLPLELKYQSFKIDQKEFEKLLPVWYKDLTPKNKPQWIKLADKLWSDKSSQTYKVFKALQSGNWQCRVCGAVPKVNPQAAARIRDIKKKGFIVATKRMSCTNCGKIQPQDILVMTKTLPAAHNELRKPLPKALRDKIIKFYNRTDCAFSVQRSVHEFVIDHKFPSQRWSKPESDNSPTTDDQEIQKKFQLLTNQTNMLKSRECDRCVFEGKRGTFFGIKWYYKGNDKWQGSAVDDENGCIGCPWYDVDKWKKELNKLLS